jgi:hypothetical protein
VAGTLPESDIDKYLRLIVERKIADAEKELEDLRPKFGNTEWNRGYVKALEGLLMTRKANSDNYLFFAKKEFDKKSLKVLVKEFADKAESPLYGDYDRGYFSGLVQLTKVMEEEGIYSLANNTHNRAEEAKTVAQ